MNASLDDTPLPPVLAPTAETLVLRASRAMIASFLVAGLGCIAFGALFLASLPYDAEVAINVALIGGWGLLLLLQVLWLLIVPLVRAGPEGLTMRFTPIWRTRRFALGDLVAIARAPAGRPRLLARAGGRERLYSLPLRTVSRADSRRLVEWLHAHVAEPGTRVLRGRDREWTRNDPPFLR